MMQTMLQFHVGFTLIKKVPPVLYQKDSEGISYILFN